MESIKEQLEAAYLAKSVIATLGLKDRSILLNGIADSLELNINTILLENEKDVTQLDIHDPRYDRLKLTDERISAIANSIRSVSFLPDPIGVTYLKRTLDNGLIIEKKSVPLGVVGVIYEARPNVTIDVAALCIQSGNVCLLRGGTDAWYTNSFLVQLIRDVLVNHSINPNVVQLLPTDRSLVEELLTATAYVDIIIPRGSQSLIDFVRKHAKVPVIETGAGVCHTFIEESADLDMAARIVANAKISRPSVCNALDTVLIDSKVAQPFVEKIIPAFLEAKVEVFADSLLFDYFKELDYPYLTAAVETDFGREYLSLKCSMRVVDNFEEALKHIAKYSSKHSECIVSTNPDSINTFMNVVDAAAVYTNASTRFTDGGEFGLGAEIGISTQKLHARGPFALEKLVTEKWFVSGTGQIR